MERRRERPGRHHRAEARGFTIACRLDKLMRIILWAAWTGRKWRDVALSVVRALVRHLCVGAERRLGRYVSVTG